MPALACDVPVFSYALQFWESDPYIVHVFHHGPLTPVEERLVALLDNDASNREAANIVFHGVDLRQEQEAALLELHATHFEDADTGVLVHYPAVTRIRRPLYAGPLTEEVVTQLLDSPVRREILKRLLRGDMAVWVLLESGNRREDNRAAQTVTTELDRMAQVLQLPERHLWVWSDDIDAEAGIRFSMLRLSRDAPEEEMLVRMLVGTEPDLVERADAPMVFPIFGRGLILYALVGPGINEWTIADACEFVIGPCSCQVKALNPGTDLILTMDWQRYIRPDPSTGLPAAAGLADFFDRGEQAAARLAALETPDVDSGVAAAATQPPSDTSGNGMWWYAMIVAPLAILVLLYIIKLGLKATRG